MIRDLELGSKILTAVRENEKFALAAVRWLMTRQDADELASGTSMHKNQRGLNKSHAELLNNQQLEKMPHQSVANVACFYTHTQLLEAVERGELVLPPEQNASTLLTQRARKRKVLHSEDDEEEESEEEQDEPSDEPSDEPWSRGRGHTSWGS